MVTDSLPPQKSIACASDHQNRWQIEIVKSTQVDHTSHHIACHARYLTSRNNTLEMTNAEREQRNRLNETFASYTIDSQTFSDRSKTEDC